jgi:anti-sigma regulatory factor (Ser/Thr protein kinase)
VAKHAQTEDIRRFILKRVEDYPTDIAKRAAIRFDISSHAVNWHVKRLSDEGLLEATGNTRGRRYKLKILSEWTRYYDIEPGLTEDTAWDDVRPVLGVLPENLMSIWNTGFTEMFNNALEHSEGKYIYLHLRKTAVNTEIAIHDNGVGIFTKIQRALSLTDIRHALLELSKGKFTTDPTRHTGEGIFFTSRMCDSFDILSSGLYLSHKATEELDMLLQRDRFTTGTAIWMKIENDSTREAEKVYLKYTKAPDSGFAKTIVPVRLAQYGGENLISRSQAKRVLAGLEKFAVITLDFAGTKAVGQGFADEIFRVFVNAHPEIEVRYMRANPSVTVMIKRVTQPETNNLAIMSELADQKP